MIESARCVGSFQLNRLKGDGDSRRERAFRQFKHYTAGPSPEPPRNRSSGRPSAADSW